MTDKTYLVLNNPKTNIEGEPLEIERNPRFSEHVTYPEKALVFQNNPDTL